MIKVRDKLYRKVHDVLKMPTYLKQQKQLKQELIDEGYEVKESGFGVLVVELKDGEIHFVTGSDGIYEYIFRQKTVLDDLSTCYNKNRKIFQFGRMKETVKIINAIGTVVHEGQVKYLHVAECECKNKLARAKTENGLKMYVGNEKFKCKECGHILKYVGQAYFKRNNRIDKSEVLNETDFNENQEDGLNDQMEQGNKQVEQQIDHTKEPINDVNGLIKGIRSRGVTNSQMISAIKENVLNNDNLKALYLAYPEIYKGSIRYLPVNARRTAGCIVQESEPDFIYDEGKRSKTTYIMPEIVGESHG